MRGILAGLMFVAAFSAAIGSAAAQDVLGRGDTLSGKLQLVETRQPNGTLTKSYQIVSEPRRMADNNDDFCANPDRKATTFHLFTKTKSDRVTLSRLLGKNVRVRVWSLFCSQTAWHVGDAAVSQWSWK